MCILFLAVLGSGTLSKPIAGPVPGQFPGRSRAIPCRCHGFGRRDDGGVAERPEYHDSYYSSFVLDPPPGNRCSLRQPNRGGVSPSAAGGDVRESLLKVDWVPSEPGGGLVVGGGAVSYTHLTLPTTPYV